MPLLAIGNNRGNFAIESSTNDIKFHFGATDGVSFLKIEKSKGERTAS